MEKDKSGRRIMLFLNIQKLLASSKEKRHALPCVVVMRCDSGLVLLWSYLHHL